MRSCRRPTHEPEDGEYERHYEKRSSTHDTVSSIRTRPDDSSSISKRPRNQRLELQDVLTARVEVQVVAVDMDLLVECTDDPNHDGVAERDHLAAHATGEPASLELKGDDRLACVR